MNVKNFITFTGLWLYAFLVFVMYQLLSGIEEITRARLPTWSYPVFVVIIPLLLPVYITMINARRYKRGHRDFGWRDAIGRRVTEPHETKEYLRAAYPPIGRKFLREIPMDLTLGVKGFWRYIVCPLSRNGMNGFLVGNIGSGKSSLLKAWLLSVLYRERIAEKTGKSPGMHYNFFVIDIKGELFRDVMKITEHYDAETDDLIQVIQPSNRKSWGWDVFYRVRKRNATDTEKIKAVTDIAEALVEDSGDNPYFSDNARKILAGILLHGINKGKEFIEIVQDIMRTEMNELLTRIVEEAEEDGEGIVLDKLKSFVGKKDNESVQDIEATLKTKLDFCGYPDIVYALKDNPNRTSPAALDDGVTNLDLAIEQDMLEAYGPMFRLLTMQVLRHCESYRESDARNTIIIADEASRIGRINGLEGMMATLRSRHVGIILAFQSIHQFLEKYSEHAAQTILSLCEMKVFMSGDGDSETAEYVAGMAGKYVTEKKSYQKETIGQKDVKYNEDLRDIVDAQSMMELKERKEVIAFLFGHYFRFKRVEYHDDRILGPIYREIDQYNVAHQADGTADDSQEV